MRFSFTSYLTGIAAFCALSFPSAVLAGPGDTATQNGTAQLVVIEPIGIQNVADLRFGRMFAGTTGGTVTMGPTGVVTDAGGMAGNTNTPQAINGRGPGGFAIFADGATSVRITTPTPTFTITNAAGDTMQVGNLTLARFSGNADFVSITIGARLTVGANQPTGNYTGTYTLRADYF